MKDTLRYQILFVLIICLAVSCKPSKHISKNDIIIIEENFSGSFLNQGYKTTTKKTEYTILNLFEIYPNATIDSIHISLIDSKHLQVSYYNPFSIYQNKNESKIFEGKLLNNGSFQIYHRKKNIEIPPLLPIFYSNRDIDRIRIFITTDGDLLIENKWARDGNIFLMSAGGSGKDLYYLKKL